MTEAPIRQRSGARRWVRAVYLAPILAFLALSAWAFASPVGAAPDDDYHLVSIWCANGGSAECEPGSSDRTRSVATGLIDAFCYPHEREQSAACQNEVWPTWTQGRYETDRGNFAGEYPPIYHSVMRAFVSSDIQTSALVMRVFNAALFVGLATALAVLLPESRRRALLWGWLVTLVPLGMFLIPSNNPSGWAITGVGTAFMALLGWFETSGRRRWALGALYALGVVMAAGSRGDAAVYAAGASLTAAILASERTREWALRSLLPVAGVLFAVIMFTSAGQSGVGAVGFTSGGGEAALPVGADGEDVGAPLGGWALAAYNLLSLPFLWTGVFGTWGLGWLDTGLPDIVPWAATAAFVAVGFAGIGRITGRKTIATGGVLAVLVVLPVYVLTMGNDTVGVNLQPRYLLPLIVLFGFLLVSEARGVDTIRFTRVQTFTILSALAVAQLVALQINIRRYVTGADQQGLNLDAGAEWWWAGLPLGPSAVWVVGALAYAGLLATLWPRLTAPRSARADVPVAA